MNCLFCSVLLTPENDHAEHIIPNALGGRLKRKGLLCNTCNNKAGAEWDAKLAEQLNPFSLILGIKRQKGTVPKQLFQEIGGSSRIWLFSNGTKIRDLPRFQRKIDEDGNTAIQLNPQSKEEALRMIKYLKAHYPKIDEAALLASITETLTPEKNILNMNVTIYGLAIKSIVKTALCFAISEGADPSQCGSIIRYLKGEQETIDSRFYTNSEVLLNRPMDRVLHCVAVSNRATNNQLMAYVELFGFHSFLIRLCANYNGPRVHSAYGIDPVTGSGFSPTVSLSLSRSEMAQVLSADQGSHTDVIQRRAATLMRVAAVREKELAANREQ